MDSTEPEESARATAKPWTEIYTRYLWPMVFPVTISIDKICKGNQVLCHAFHGDRWFFNLAEANQWYHNNWCVDIASITGSHSTVPIRNKYKYHALWYIACLLCCLGCLLLLQRPVCRWRMNEWIYSNFSWPQLPQARYQFGRITPTRNHYQSTNFLEQGNWNVQSKMQSMGDMCDMK